MWLAIITTTIPIARFMLISNALLPTPSSPRGVRQEASKAPMERQSRSLSWQAGETSSSSGQGERVVFLTTPCITLEAFVETKVCTYCRTERWLVDPTAFDTVWMLKMLSYVGHHPFEAFLPPM